MRRISAYILLGLGVFLIALAGVLRFAVLPAAAKAPLDADSKTPSDGVARVLFDAGALEIVEDVPLTALRTTVGDVDAGNGDVAVYDTFIPVLTADESVIADTKARFAFDRKTSQMVDCCDSNLEGAPITDYNGIMPLKFPFNTEKTTYQYYDTTLAKALPADFDGEDELYGLPVYRFVQTIAAEKYTTLTVPGTLVGTEDASVDADRFYANTRTLWVEPRTGVIVKGQEEQVQSLRIPGSSEDALTLLDAQLAFTDEYVEDTAADTQDSIRLLNLIGTTAPIVALLLGIVAIVIAFFLGRGAGREEG